MEREKIIDDIEVILHSENALHLKGRQKPSSKNISDMIKVYSKTPDELKQDLILALEYRTSNRIFKGLEYFFLEFLIKINRKDLVWYY